MIAKEQKLPEVWVLSDERPGHTNQSLGIAEALGWPFVIKKIVYNTISKLPNLMYHGTLLSVPKTVRDHIAPPWPDIVIAAGRKLAPIAAYIRKKSEGKTFVVQVMWPGQPAKDMDVIAVPSHDVIADHAAVMTLLGAPNRVNPDFLQTEAAIWEQTFKRYKQPYIAVLVGGKTRVRNMRVQDAVELAQRINEFASPLRASVFITASGRTPPEAIKALESELRVPAYVHDNKSRANPYYGFIALADYIVVTGDSVSMCSEACASGKPVFIFSREDWLPAKHQRFIDTLLHQGYAKSFVKENFEHYSKYKPRRLENTVQLAGAVKQKFLQAHPEFSA